MLQKKVRHELRFPHVYCNNIPGPILPQQECWFVSTTVADFGCVIILRLSLDDIDSGVDDISSKPAICLQLLLALHCNLIWSGSLDSLLCTALNCSRLPL